MKLKELYESYTDTFKEIVGAFPEKKLHGPLLMSVTDEYKNSKVKILIVGQETNGWGLHSENITQGMEAYKKFNLGENYHSSPFWNITRKIESALDNNPYSCSWTNLSKFDDDSKKPTGEVAKKISEIDSLLKEEIKILKPDVIIFFTSHAFDMRLKKIFENVDFKTTEGFTNKECVQLEHQDLPKLTLRTYHPKYLRIKKYENNFIELIKNLSTT